MKAVTKTWLTFAILAAVTGACGDSGGNNDGAGTTGGGATAGGATAGGATAGGATAGADGGGTTAGNDGGGTGSGLPTDPNVCGADASGKVYDSRKAGGCYYFYCTRTEADLKAQATPGGACASDVDLARLCDGSAVKTVAKCARQEVASAADSEAFAAAITKCAKPQVSGFSDACLACNVQSAVCAGKFDNCLVDCRDGDSEACDDCRQEKGCTPDFYTCAGLPDPLK